MTGAAGFIGSHLCHELAGRGDSVDAVDVFTDYYDPALKRRNAEAFAGHDAVRLIEQDLAVADLDELFDGADAVIHLAGQPGVRLSWAQHFDVYVERNIIVSQRVLEAARRTHLPRLVLASSSSVYGNAPAYPTSEESPTRPFSPYGVTKLAMEHLAWSYADNWGVPVVALRYFTVYGPRQRPDMGMNRFIARVAAGEPIQVYGDGEQIRDFTYVSDVVAATIAAALLDVVTPTVLNIAGGSSTTVSNVLRLIGEHVGAEVLIEHVEEQPGDVRVTGGVIDRATRMLGWRPTVTLEEGLKRQVAHQLATIGS